MAIEFRAITDSEPVVDYLAGELHSQLTAGRRVLWLLTGGSAMSVAITVATQLRTSHTDVSRLQISLIDERYGPIGHPDSNWQQLADKGFDLPGATLLPVLDGQSLAGTAAAYDALLQSAFANSDFTLGFFGIGPDGHVAGILPGSPALHTESDQLATGYDDSEITIAAADSPAGVKRGVARLTMTPAAIRRLDLAVCLAMGASKLAAIQQLQQAPDGDSQSVADLPARLLNSVPTAIVFSDQLL